MTIDGIAFESAQKKLNELAELFLQSVKRVVNFENSDFNSSIESFVESIPSIIINNEISEALEPVYEAYDIVADNAKDQYLLYVELFRFGENDSISSLSQRQITNNTQINNYVNNMSLCYAYQSASQIDYSNQDELEEIIKTLDNQYQYVLGLDIDSNTRASLIEIRTATNSYFSQLELRDIVTINTKQTTSTLLSYLYYKDSSFSDQIIALNSLQNTGFIEGDLKILST